MNFKQLAAVFCLSAASIGVQATEKMYGAITGGYTDADYSEVSVDGLSYKLTFGHEISRQWYVEAGYQQLFDDLDDVEGAKGDALFLAVLGKAGNQTGELFYRLGVLNVDVQGSEFAIDGQCAVGDISGTDASGNAICSFDDGGIAGVVGFGFDFFVGLNSMIRIEAEHIRGQDGLSVNAAYLGFRYNFN